MIRNRSRVAALTPVLALVLALPALPARALTGVPATGDLEFTVLRDGTAVGTHSIRFHRDGPGLEVDVATHVNVKLPLVGLSVYHFEHTDHEVWRDGALVSLASRTDDDGTARHLDVSRDGGRLRVRSNDAEHASPADLVPASLWDPELVHRQVLLNTLDGREMPISVEDRGIDPVPVHGHAVDARHFVVSGGLDRELWYDHDGVLVKVAFAAKDDSRIEYVLR
jgi:hypothetical protein